MNKTFKSTRLFQIWIYTVSHSRLILRSVNNKDEEIEGFNIDIEFFFGGGAYIEMPDSLVGIRIQKIESDILKKTNVHSTKIGYNVFEIATGDQRYFIVATGFCVGRNNWFNENRVLNPYLEYDEIIVRS